MIQLKDDFEISFWVAVYTKNCGQEDVYHDGDPAGDTADKAIRALRCRVSNPSKHETDNGNQYLNSPNYHS